MANNICFITIPRSKQNQSERMVTRHIRFQSQHIYLYGINNWYISHNGINVNYWCVIIISIHIMFFLHFLMKNMWIILGYSHNCQMYKKKNELTVYKKYQVKKVTVFKNRKFHHLLFPMHENLKTCQNQKILESQLLEIISMLNPPS